MKCDKCDSAYINGHFCHEHGCPNTYKHYDKEEDVWIEIFTCRECGFELPIGEDTCDCMEPVEGEDIDVDDIDDVAEKIDRFVYMDDHYDAIIGHYPTRQDQFPDESKESVIEKLINEIALFKVIEATITHKDEDEELDVLMAYPDDNGKPVSDENTFFYLHSFDEITELMDKETAGDDWTIVKINQ